MTQNSSGFRPFFNISFTSMQKYKPILIGLQVHYFHFYKPPDISFQPAAHIIDHCHILYIFTVFCVDYIYFWIQIECINKILMWIISIMYYCCSWSYMIFQSCIYSFWTWFSMTTNGCQHFLTGINSHYDAYLSFRQSSWMHFVIVWLQYLIIFNVRFINLWLNPYSCSQKNNGKFIFFTPW